MNATVTVLRPYVLQINMGDHIRNQPHFTAKAARIEAKRLAGAPKVQSITLIDMTIDQSKPEYMRPAPRSLLWEA